MTIGKHAAITASRPGGRGQAGRDRRGRGGAHRRVRPGRVFRRRNRSRKLPGQAAVHRPDLAFLAPMIVSSGNEISRYGVTDLWLGVLPGGGAGAWTGTSGTRKRVGRGVALSKSGKRHDGLQPSNEARWLRRLAGYCW